MTDTGSGHLPEHLILGVVFSSLAFFCTAVMSALVKATEEHVDGSRPALPKPDLPDSVPSDRTPRRMGVGEDPEDWSAHSASRQLDGRVVLPVRRHGDDAADQRNSADIQRSAVDAGDRVGVVPREGITGRSAQASASSVCFLSCSRNITSSISVH
jgi:hypothetical protein